LGQKPQEEPGSSDQPQGSGSINIPAEPQSGYGQATPHGEKIPFIAPDEGNVLTAEKKYMETHAHALHKAPGEGWKHYLFEFLMLFLAVTLGFIVENLREHFVEHDRANQFLQSMLVDVRTNKRNLDSLMQLDRGI